MKPLRREDNPFESGEGSLRPGRALQTALGEVIEQIGAGAPFVVVQGSAGAGKSLLLDMTLRACTTMGLSVRHVDRADRLQLCLRERSDVLLIDRAEAIPSSALQQLFAADHEQVAGTAILFGRSEFASRFADHLGVRAAVVQLQSLADSEARGYLTERAASIGRPNDLFAPDALELIIYGSRGSLQRARSLAKFAFVAATADGASQIELEHVADVLSMQLVPEAEAEAQHQAAAPAIPRPELEAEAVRQAPPASDESPTPELVVENLPASDQPRNFKGVSPPLRQYWGRLNLTLRQWLSAVDRSLYQRIDALLPRALMGAGAFLALTAFAGLVLQFRSDQSFAAGPVLQPQQLVGTPLPTAPRSSPETDRAETAKQIPAPAPADRAPEDVTRAPILPSAKPAGIGASPQSVTAGTQTPSRKNGATASGPNSQPAAAAVRTVAPAAKRPADRTRAQLRGTRDENSQKEKSDKAESAKTPPEQQRASENKPDAAANGTVAAQQLATPDVAEIKAKEADERARAADEFERVVQQIAVQTNAAQEANDRARAAQDGADAAAKPGRSRSGVRALLNSLFGGSE